MTVHILVPTHNRREITSSFLERLFEQDVQESVVVVVVDAGSVDGTLAMLHLRQQMAPCNFRLTVLEGKASWWWAQSMAKAVEHISTSLQPKDVVIFANDDVLFTPGVLSKLAGYCRDNNSIIQAKVARADAPQMIIDRGAKLKPDTLDIYEVKGPGFEVKLSEIDVATGRTTAFPAPVILRGLNVNFRSLPHHLADIEFSVRARRLGYPIFLAEDVVVLSTDEFSSERTHRGLWRRMAHVSSPERLLSYWAFWRTVSPEVPPTVLVWRCLRYLILPKARAAISRLPAVSRRLMQKNATKGKAE